MEVFSNVSRSRKIFFQPREADDYSDLLSGHEKAGQVVRTPRDVGIRMVRETEVLRNHAIPIKVNQGSFTLHPYIEQFSLLFLSHRMRRSVIFDGMTLGLDADIPDTPNSPAVFRPVGYYDFVSTNLLSPYDVGEVGRQEPLLRGRSLIFDSRGNLRKLSLSRLANVVGVSVLAFTTEGKLLLVRQTLDVAGSPGLVAPSGSGALEPRDLAGTGASTLQRTILNGALRELREECNLEQEDLAGDAEVIGYGRWVSRGAMPEFCALALLNKSADQILRQSVRTEERPFVGDVVAVRLPVVPDWSAVDPLDVLPPTYRHAVSWPLAFSLTCLVESMRDLSWNLGSRLRGRLSSGETGEA
ncbi:NUDIX hydrolase [Micromonospora gifhornensis]|uniref:NUDIX hydrolase n=1 Tax=Micromonospora gifhornensis TaxID=84594 RepID=UPI003665C997